MELRRSSVVTEMFYAVWCRRTDELVDGPNASYMSSAVLDRWEERLHDIFDGRPYDILDAALTHTIHNFPLDIKVLENKPPHCFHNISFFP